MTAEHVIIATIILCGILTLMLNMHSLHGKADVVTKDRLLNSIKFSEKIFRTEEIQEDGSIVIYLHDKPKLKSSKVIWKSSPYEVSVSGDGGKTYKSAMLIDDEDILIAIRKSKKSEE